MTSLYFAYYKDAKFYGIPKGSAERVVREFAQFHVNYYFLIGPEARPSYVRDSDRIDSGNIPNVRVYRVTAEPL